MVNFKFTKMHALGNDFIVLDAIHQNISFSANDIATLSQRHTGIGFDQCLLIERAKTPEVDFFYRIYNADGSEVGQCGNGARCLARFIEHYHLTEKKHITVATATTVMQLYLNEDQSVTIELPPPEFQPKKIPLQFEQEQDIYSLPIHDNSFPIHALSVGNPHAVTNTAHLEQFDITTLGREISQHPLFPEHCNAGFMHILSPNQMNLRVYERGCGETQACGSGAVAAAVVGRRYHQMDESITVNLPGGPLQVCWKGLDHPIFLTGPAHFIYEGTLLTCG